MKKIFIVCPGDTVTGGPELLHQFAHSLASQGINARMIYFPFNKAFEVPDAYKIYNIKQSHINEVKDENVFLSETQTNLIRYFPQSQINIWWLSLDFYYGVKKETVADDIIRYLWTLAFRRQSLWTIKRHRHWAQSHYAQDYLSRKGIDSRLLGDYLNINHEQQQKIRSDQKKNIILFNPKKGIARTKKLIQENPHFEFIAIENMSPSEVSNLLRSAKIYIDFGNHPGKDRLPREAAIAGCCIITGTHGSAGNIYDYPIPNRYKLNDYSSDYIKNFEPLANEIINNYDTHLANFKLFRQAIRREKQIFDESVKKLIKQL